MKEHNNKYRMHKSKHKEEFNKTSNWQLNRYKEHNKKQMLKNRNIKMQSPLSKMKKMIWKEELSNKNS